MKRFLALIFLLSAFATGAYANATCGNPNANPDCPKSKDQASCLAHGGQWQIVGLSPNPSCLCPTVDAGCPCTSSNDCSGGMCIGKGDLGQCKVEGATCAAQTPTVGCLCMVTGDGHADAICID